LSQYRRLSDVAKRTLPCELGVRYGDAEGELLHHFPSRRAGRPLLVYVHGGHWQELGIDDSCFAASALAKHDVGFLAVGYGLAPKRTLDEMAISVGRALAWVRANAVRLGATATAIYAAGSSAGAQLLAMALGNSAAASPVGIAGVALLSGVYDLAPVRLSYVNAALQLSEADARRNSPIRRLPLGVADVLVARGETETAEYARQHDLMVAGLRHTAARAPVVQSLVCSGRNHFDLPLGLGDPGDELGRAVLRQMRVWARA
jgi:arylformamidase